MHTRRLRAAATLFLGTAGSFTITVASTAIVARLFPPSAFGELAEFMAWIAVPAAIGTLRLSDAIPLTDTPDQERRIFRGAVEVLLLVAVCGGGIVCVVPRGTEFVSTPSPLWRFGLGAAFVVVLGVSRLAVMFATKRGWFRWIGVLGLAFPAGTLVGQLAVWWMGGTLVEGSVLGATVAACPAVWLLVRHAPSLRGWPLAMRGALARYPEFARYAVPFAVIDTLRVRAPYLFAGLPTSGVSPTELGCLQQADRVSGWPRMGLSAILRPIYHHAATTDPVRAASDATTVTIRLLVLASAPVTWAVLNAQLVVQIVLGPGWERAILPLQLLLWPSVVFVAADFTDRLFDMHRRQHVLMAVSVIACVVTLAGVVLSTLVFPSVVGLAGTMSAVMLGYSIACLLAVGRLGRVLWRSYRRHALRIASNAAIVVMTALAAGELLDRAAAIASAGAALVLTILEARVAISGIIHNTRH